MLRFLVRTYWKLSGWKISGTFPYDLPKMVLIVAPHTSWKDILVGLAVRDKLKINHAKFLGKKELFEGPFGKLFRKLGGIPVDRTGQVSGKEGIVNQAVQLFNENETFLLALAPEGTRKKVKKLRTGFYHIAKNAGVPIVPVGFDFENKQVIFGKPLYPGQSEEEDFKKIASFYYTIKGANPNLGMDHFKV
ncbi:MAG: 1-acyl-sn-glycerol-3-phosphate acyltransferase [Ginsengibacter sp.]